MPDLHFNIDAVEPTTFAATPQLALKLRISQPESEAAHRVQAIVLRCQIRIEPMGRRYSEDSQRRLNDLCGPPERWSQTLRTMLWQHTSAVVPPFEKDVVVDLPVVCSFDFNVAATKYFYALEEGDVPVRLLFSGTIFYTTEASLLQIAQIPWEKEATFRLPVRVWREMMDHYYPNSAWLCVRRDMFDQIAEYKSRNGIPTWDEALAQLLNVVDERTDKLGALK
jgi:hypothetical protein